MSGLSLSQIAILLHYYYSPEEHPACSNASAWRSTIDGLLEHGLLRDRVGSTGFGATYETTERAKPYIEAIRALPLPVQTWAMP